MKLHASDTTPYGRKVRIVLEEKGLAYERDLRGAAQRPVEEQAALNPVLRVPILEDDGRVLFESNLVIDYLLTRYPGRSAGSPLPPLAPSPARPEHVWEDRMLQGVLDALLESSVNLRQLGMSGVAPEQSSYLQRHQQRIVHILDWLEPRAAPEGLLPGWFSVQDVSLVCALEFGAHFRLFDRGGRPRLEALLQRLAARPSAVATRLPAAA
jgi:glutathione S-transferase